MSRPDQPSFVPDPAATLDPEAPRRERAALRDEALRLQGIAETALARSRHLEQRLVSLTQQAGEVEELNVRAHALEMALQRVQARAAQLATQQAKAEAEGRMREARLREDIAALQGRLAEAQDSRDHAEVVRAAVESERDTILNSMSWRLTHLPRRWLSTFHRA